MPVISVKDDQTANGVSFVNSMQYGPFLVDDQLIQPTRGGSGLTFTMNQSSDGGATWSPFDIPGTACVSYGSVQDNAEIISVYTDANVLGTLFLTSYDPVTNTFTPIDSIIPALTPLVRAFVYVGPGEYFVIVSSGTGYVGYRYNGGWSAPINVSQFFNTPSAFPHITSYACARETDQTVHFFANYDTTIGERQYYQEINADNSLGNFNISFGFRYGQPTSDGVAIFAPRMYQSGTFGTIERIVWPSAVEYAYDPANTPTDSFIEAKAVMTDGLLVVIYITDGSSGTPDNAIRLSYINPADIASLPFTALWFIDGDTQSLAPCDDSTMVQALGYQLAGAFQMVFNGDDLNSGETGTFFLGATILPEEDFVSPIIDPRRLAVVSLPGPAMYLDSTGASRHCFPMKRKGQC